MRHTELDRIWILRAVLLAQLPAWILQGVRLHDHGRFRRRKSLRPVHHVIRCVRCCWSIASFPTVVGQQCQWQLRFVPVIGVRTLGNGWCLFGWNLSGR